MQRILRSSRLCLALILMALNLGASIAHAAGGKIVFDSQRDGTDQIYIMNSDGSSQTRLTSDSSAHTRPALNTDGSKIAYSSNSSGPDNIYTMNVDGSNVTQLTGNNADNGDANWSHDGTRITFTSRRDAGNYEIYVMNADGSNQTRLTNNPAIDQFPAFSPDGSKIVFRSSRNGNSQIYVMNADGSNQTRLTNNTFNDLLATYSPDGSKIVFESDRSGKSDIWVMNADGSNQTQLTSNSGDNHRPVFSPDGTAIAFDSTRDGNQEIYTMNADGSNPTRLTTTPALDRTAYWGPAYVAVTPTPLPTVTPAPTATPAPTPTPTLPPSGPPTITFTAPSNGGTYSLLSAVTGTAQASVGRSLTGVTWTLQCDSDYTYWNGTAWTVDRAALPTTLNGNTWSYTGALPPANTLLGGSYTLTATAADDTADSASLIITVTLGVPDTRPPTVRILMPVNNSAARSLAFVNGMAADNMGGSGLDHVALTLQRLSDGAYWGSSAWFNGPVELATALTITKDGSTWIIRSGLPSGSQLGENDYVVKAIAYDKAGNRGVSSPVKFRLDRTPPTISLVAPANGAILTGLTLVRGVAQDNGGVGHVTLTIRRNKDGRYWTGTLWSPLLTTLPATLFGTVWLYRPVFPTKALQDGLYTLQVTAQDQAGNASGATAVVRIDATAPVSLTFTSPAAGTTVPSLTVIRGTAQDNADGSGLQSVGLYLQRRSDNKFWTGRGWSSLPTLLTTRLSGTSVVTWICVSPLPTGSTLPATAYALTAIATDRALNARRADMTFKIQNSTTHAQEGASASEPVVISAVGLSSATVGPRSSLLALKFTGALDADNASDPSHYSVEIGGQPALVECASYNAKTHTVVLSLEAGAWRAGTPLAIHWTNLRDSMGAIVLASAISVK